MQQIITLPTKPGSDTGVCAARASGWRVGRAHPTIGRGVRNRPTPVAYFRVTVPVRMRWSEQSPSGFLLPGVQSLDVVRASAL